MGKKKSLKKSKISNAFFPVLQMISQETLKYAIGITSIAMEVRDTGLEKEAIFCFSNTNPEDLENTGVFNGSPNPRRSQSHSHPPFKNFSNFKTPKHSKKKHIVSCLVTCNFNSIYITSTLISNLSSDPSSVCRYIFRTLWHCCQRSLKLSTEIECLAFRSHQPLIHF